LAFGGSFGECDTLCSQYARARVILQNDRRDEEIPANGGGVLLVPGAQCRPGKYEKLLSRDENFVVSNAPPNAPETARLYADVPSNNSAGNLAALNNSYQKANSSQILEQQHMKLFYKNKSKYINIYKYI